MLDRQRLLSHGCHPELASPIVMAYWMREYRATKLEHADSLREIAELQEQLAEHEENR